MSDIEKMASMRVDKAKDNLEVRPIDLLRTAIHDLESGVTKADGMMILMVHRPEKGLRTYETYRCGLTRDQEAAHLMISQDISHAKMEGRKVNENTVKVTDLDAAIRSAQYHRFEQAKTTVCMLTLDNGFEVVGASACVDPANFDQRLGEKYALEDARRKAYDYSAFRLQDKLHGMREG